MRIVVGSRVHDIGVYRPQHTWQFDGGIVMKHVDRRHVPEPIAEALRAGEPEPEPEKPKKRR